MRDDELFSLLPCAKELTEAGADRIACISTAEIPFELEVRKICESNGCGAYGANYGCPPLNGEAEELIAKAKRYAHVLVFQKVYRIEDSFDIEGMQEGSRQFRELFYRFWDIAKAAIPDCLVLGAGGCGYCEVCAAKTHEPCRRPDRQSSSLEGYCIVVSRLAAKCDMKYINGVNTVTYFGGVFF